MVANGNVDQVIDPEHEKREEQTGDKIERGTNKVSAVSDAKVPNNEDVKETNVMSQNNNEMLRDQDSTALYQKVRAKL